MGDLIIALEGVACTHGGKGVVTGVYVGNGKFVLVSRNTGCTEDCSTSYIDAAVSTESVDMPASSVSVWSDAAALNTKYKFYFVLRPERLASDAVQSISMDKATAELEIGNNVTLVASKNPTTAADATTTTWTSSNTSVATVDAAGKVTAVAAGTATITVNCDGYTASCAVTVTAPAGEPRDITTGVLTQAEMDAIKALTSLTVANPGPVANEIYGAANIKVVDSNGNDVFGKLGFSAVLAKLFDSTTGQLLASPDATYGAMLMPGYYGGSAYKSSTGSNGRAFVPADFRWAI